MFPQPDGPLRSSVAGNRAVHAGLRNHARTQLQHCRSRAASVRATVTATWHLVAVGHLSVRQISLRRGQAPPHLLAIPSALEAKRLLELGVRFINESFCCRRRSVADSPSHLL